VGVPEANIVEPRVLASPAKEIAEWGCGAGSGWWMVGHRGWGGVEGVWPRSTQGPHTLQRRSSHIHCKDEAVTEATSHTQETCTVMHPGDMHGDAR
jgi:hypothetical protein